MYLNQVTIIGTLAADTEFSQTQSGRPQCRFRIEVRKPLPMIGENPMDIFDCFAQGDQVRVLEDEKKGSWVAITGRLLNTDYQDAGGSKRTATRIAVQTARFMPTAQETETDAIIARVPASMD